MVKDVWNIQDNDKLVFDDLLEIRDFFLDDLFRAQKALEKVKRFEKYNLPGYQDQLQKALDEIDESLENIAIVNRKIAQAR